VIALPAQNPGFVPVDLAGVHRLRAPQTGDLEFDCFLQFELAVTLARNVREVDKNSLRAVIELGWVRSSAPVVYLGRNR
jgi:hypothetical protein